MPLLGPLPFLGAGGFQKWETVKAVECDEMERLPLWNRFKATRHGFILDRRRPLIANNAMNGAQPRLQSCPDTSGRRRVLINTAPLMVSFSSGNRDDSGGFPRLFDDHLKNCVDRVDRRGRDIDRQFVIGLSEWKAGAIQDGYAGDFGR